LDEKIEILKQQLQDKKDAANAFEEKDKLEREFDEEKN
jgi:hypothetical protein